MTNDEFIKLVLNVSGTEGLEELKTKALEAAKALEEVKTEAGGVEKKTLDLKELAGKGQSLFSSLSGGDIPGIIDGLTELAGLVPGVSAFSPAIKAVGEAAKAGWPILKEWYGQLSEVSTKMKEATKELNEHTKAIEAHTVALKDSDAVAAMRAADATAKATPSSRAKQRGEVFSGLIKGREEETATDIMQAIHDDRADERKELLEKIEADFKKEMDSLKSRHEQDPEGFDFNALRVGEDHVKDLRRQALMKIETGEQGQAETLLAKAKAGDADAIKKIQQYMPKGSVTGEVARLASVEEQREQANAAAEAEEQRQRPEKMRQLRDKTMKNLQAKIKGDVMPGLGKGLQRFRVGATKGRDAQAEIEKRRQDWNKMNARKSMFEIPQAKTQQIPHMQPLDMNKSVIENQAIIAETQQISGMILSQVAEITRSLKQTNRGYRQMQRTNQNNGGG